MKNYKIILMGIVTEAFYKLMEATYFEEIGLCSITSYLRKYDYEVKLEQERFLR